MSRFIFITGGVVSSLGKGVATASLGAMLKARGYSVNAKKLDPYLNIDPGTMNPIQHGEVFVTTDGAETDLDLGHYERFLGIHTTAKSNLTSGKAYQALLQAERRGEYLGSTVQVVPHLVNVIQDFITEDSDRFDFVLCEIGGTVGDIESAPFLEAIRQLKRRIDTGKILGQSLFIHTTFIPYIKAAKEAKTKPTQHSVKTLMSFGIEPDIILCRTETSMTNASVSKIALFCNVEEESIIEAPNLDSIYNATIVYAQNLLDVRVLSLLGIQDIERGFGYLAQWKKFSDTMHSVSKPIDVVIVGKYSTSVDAYKSLVEALHHACIEVGLKFNFSIVEAGNLQDDPSTAKLLSGFDIIVIAGGFGSSQAEGKINAIKYARQNKIPFLGICFGMQLCIIEFCRNVLCLKNANSTELDDSLSESDAVVDAIEEFRNKDGTMSYTRASSNFAGKMHLGSSDITIKPNSLAWEIYNSDTASERHRHRYQIMTHYETQIKSAGGLFSGHSPSLNLPEIFELRRDVGSSNQVSHPFFVGVQFHPEFNSAPFSPHPLFINLIRAGERFRASKRSS